MCCQRSIRPDICECYEDTIDEKTGDFYKSGEYIIKETEDAKHYQKYLDNENSILNYAWGVWTTAYALEALMDLGKCVKDNGLWLYSDTDSVYACGWDCDKLNEFNRRQKEKLKAAGYGPVVKNGREYWPGIAEYDGTYLEFIGLHSKCYAVRKLDGTLKITVAGVPKRGALCLDNDLNNFHDGFIFSGEVTGKLTHYYMYRERPVVENGIEKGDSVDLHACDYVITSASIYDLPSLLSVDEVEVPTYGI